MSPSRRSISSSVRRAARRIVSSTSPAASTSSSSVKNQPSTIDAQRPAAGGAGGQPLDEPAVHRLEAVQRRLALGDLHLGRGQALAPGPLGEPAGEEGLAAPYSPRTALNTPWPDDATASSSSITAANRSRSTASTSSPGWARCRGAARRGSRAGVAQRRSSEPELAVEEGLVEADLAADDGEHAVAVDVDQLLQLAEVAADAGERQRSEVGETGVGDGLAVEAGQHG